MWVNDRIQGEGELIVGPRQASLSRAEVVAYRGEFQAGTRQGYGEGTFASGVRYLGHWRGDSPHGWGTMVYPNGDVGEGEFREGVLAEIGLMVFRSHDHEHEHANHHHHALAGGGAVPGTNDAPLAPAAPAVLSEPSASSSSSSFFLLSCMSAITPLPLLEDLPGQSLPPTPCPPPHTQQQQQQEESSESWPLPPSQVPLRDELYRGPWVDNFPHGFGVMDYSSGNIFLGAFSRGLREGRGLLLRKTGKSARERMAEGTEEDFGGLLEGVRGREGEGGLLEEEGLAITASHGAFCRWRWEDGSRRGGRCGGSRGNSSRGSGEERRGETSAGGVVTSVLPRSSQYLSEIEQVLQWGLKFQCPTSAPSSKCSSQGASPREGGGALVHQEGVGSTPGAAFPFEIVRGVWREDRLKEVFDV
jgi:hypothetical protein